MAQDDVRFEGIEAIPGLREVVDANDDTIFYSLTGNCPIVVVAPHSGTTSSTPEGAKAFGNRGDDPGTGRTPTLSDDRDTLWIAFATVRALASMGFVPYAAINLVSRKFMDLNRTWAGQEMWDDGSGPYRPGDEDKTAAQFPRVAEFRTFKETYYDRFHSTIRGFTTSQNPDGWLFDIHGRTVEGADLVPFAGYGHYARRDFAYDNGDASMHAHLERQGFSLIPATPDPGQEVGGAANPTTNLISGGRYGARAFDPASDPVPFAGIVVPTQAHRVHGIQFEFAGEIRTGVREELESLGVRLGYAIAGFLLDNGVLDRDVVARDGRATLEWASQLL